MPDWNPGTLLSISGAYWRTCALHAAIKLEIFDVIGDQTLDSRTIAERTGSDLDGCHRLLTFLTAFELLTKTDQGYRNTDASRSWLCRDSEDYLGYIMMHHHHLMDSWARLDEAVRTGKPVRQRASSREETREAFLMGMFNTAKLQAPDLVKTVDLTGRKRLLDLGGGPGTYAIHFCQENPELTAVVFDLPTTRPFAEQTIARYSLKDRITFHAGDFIEQQDLGSNYDVVWMSHVLHGEGPDTCEEIVRKGVDTLEPGGLMLIHDFYVNDSEDGPVFPALFSLNMLTGTEEGRSYTESQVRSMMHEAGIEHVQRIPFTGHSESGILMGRKSS